MTRARSSASQRAMTSWPLEWMRGVDKTQLLVDMLKECAWITAHASLIYYLQLRAFYLKSCCQAAIPFHFISAVTLNSSFTESGILSDRLSYFGRKIHKGPQGFSGTCRKFAKQPRQRCLKKKVNYSYLHNELTYSTLHAVVICKALILFLLEPVESS